MAKRKWACIHGWVDEKLNKEQLLELVDQFVSGEDIEGIYCDELDADGYYDDLQKSVEEIEDGDKILVDGEVYLFIQEQVNGDLIFEIVGYPDNKIKRSIIIDGSYQFLIDMVND